MYYVNGNSNGSDHDNDSAFSFYLYFFSIVILTLTHKNSNFFQLLGVVICVELFCNVFCSLFLGFFYTLRCVFRLVSARLGCLAAGFSLDAVCSFFLSLGLCV